MQAGRMIIVAGIIAAVAVGVVVAVSQAPASEDGEASTNFPIKVDFARVIPYENLTDPSLARGYVLNIRLLYGEEGPPRPFYLLFLKQGESWDDLTTPEEWVKQDYNGFEVLSSSKEFDLFTEYYPFDPTIIPFKMKLYCESCEENWSNAEQVWQGIDMRITKIKGLLVEDDPEFYEVAFALGNDQLDTLPASGTVEFRITDSIGVILFEIKFEVKRTDFSAANVPIKLLRIPMGGKAFYAFSIPTEQIKSSPTGNKVGFAFLNFALDDGRILSTGIRDVNLPRR